MALSGSGAQKKEKKENTHTKQNKKKLVRVVFHTLFCVNPKTKAINVMVTSQT